MDNTYGQHIIAELYRCQNIEKYDNEVQLKALLTRCAEEADATILSISTHKFEPQGISGLVYLAESHISTHVWTQSKYIAFDCYSCGTDTNPRKALNYFVKAVDSQQVIFKFIKRGLPSNSAHESFNNSIVQSMYIDEMYWN